MFSRKVGSQALVCYGQYVLKSALRKYTIKLSILIMLAMIIAGCESEDMLPPLESQPIVNAAVPAAASTPAPESTAVPASALERSPYLNPELPIEQRVEDLLSRMTMEEKIGQMTQVEKNSIIPSDINNYFIGSLLSGGGGSPENNSVSGWVEMTNRFQEQALKTRLAIPLIYGVDAVHGHGNLKGATVFPHNIGLGATRDPDLVERIARATAAETAATGIWWDFAPVVAVVQDIRWGRTYEAYAERTDLVSELGVAYIRGSQQVNGQTDLSDRLSVLATAKHFVGDGATIWGTSTFNRYMLDQGDMELDEATVRSLLLPPYQAAIDAGVQSIMVSFNSWNGKKMHAHKTLLTDVLKGELGFEGFLISDWQAIEQLPGDYDNQIVASINAGLDMIMVPYDYVAFINGLTRAVNEGRISAERIDDAVRRILKVKFELGLFEHPYVDPETFERLDMDAHHALAREAVRKSLVLLKNEEQTLPLSKESPLIFVAGLAANDIGLQSGGWTIEWQGKPGAIAPGTTILDGIRQAVSSNTRVEYDRFGVFGDIADDQQQPLIADVGIVVVAEEPYAEGFGDSADLSLADTDRLLIENMKAHSKRLVVVLLSGRPMIITRELAQVDAFVAAWLPGSEGAGVADVLFGDYDFTGKLSYTWPRSIDQLPFDFSNLASEGCDAPLFAYGYGLSVSDPSPEILDCAEE